jgi:hypothetical protein
LHEHALERFPLHINTDAEWRQVDPTLDISIPLGRGEQQWLFVLPENQWLHDGRRRRFIDQAFVQKVLRNTEAMNREFESLAASTGAEPFRLPLLREHQMDGPSFGDLLEFKRAARGKKSGMWIRASYTGAGRSAIRTRKYRHVSIRIVDEFTTQTGKTFGPVVAEVSLTNYPRFQTLGKITETKGLVLSMNGANEMDPEEIQALIQAAVASAMEPVNAQLAVVVEALGAQDEAAEDTDDAEETEEAEASDDTEEEEVDTAAMAASIAQATAEAMATAQKPVVDALGAIAKHLDRQSGLNLAASSGGAGGPKGAGKKVVDIGEKIKANTTVGMSKREALLAAVSE